MERLAGRTEWSCIDDSTHVGIWRVSISDAVCRSPAAESRHRMRNRFITPPRLVFTITLAAMALHAFAVGHYVAISDIPAALWQPDPASFGQIYVYFSIVPRVLVALLAGGALAFTGVIFQQLLKNPLAEPSTLGILSGAQLAITLLSLSTVAVTAGEREIAGLVGGLVAVTLVAGLGKASFKLRTDDTPSLRDGDQLFRRLGLRHTSLVSPRISARGVHLGKWFTHPE